MSSNGPVAAIDVGTNTCLLLVAERSGGESLAVLEDGLRRPQLGKGLLGGGALNGAARERTLQVLAEFLEIVEGHGIPLSRCWAVGTAVLRRASDGADFVGEVRQRLGLHLEVLSGEQEARLAWEAAAGSAPAERDTLVLDVGGGSSELAWDAGRQRVSLPMGALTLTEEFLQPGASGGWSELENHLSGLLDACPRGSGRERECLLLGGAAANLVSLVRGGPDFRVEGLHGLRASVGEAWGWARGLHKRTPAERIGLPIEPDRAEILPAGLACLAALLQHCEATGGRFSAQGLRFALARRLLG